MQNTTGGSALSGSSRNVEPLIEYDLLHELNWAHTMLRDCLLPQSVVTSILDASEAYAASVSTPGANKAVTAIMDYATTYRLVIRTVVEGRMCVQGYHGANVRKHLAAIADLLARCSAELPGSLRPAGDPLTKEPWSYWSGRLALGIWQGRSGA